MKENTIIIGGGIGGLCSGIRLLSKGYRVTLLEKNEKILNQPMINLKEIINLSFIKSMCQINPIPSTYKYINKLISNDKLRNYLIFTSMYIGINPYTNSNIYTLIPAISHLYGLWYIEGGFYKYVKSLEQLFLDLGGKIITNSEVEKILIENNKVKGVKVENEILDCDLIVCNADYPYAVNNLIDNKFIEKKYSKNKLNKIDYSCSVFILYLSLDKVYSNLNVHNIYISKNFRNGIEDAFKGELPSDPSLYIYYPASIDETFKTNNNSSMNIMLRVPNLSFDNINYDESQIKALKKYILSSLKNIKELEDIENHILYESYLTPIDLQNKFNTYYGNAFGLSHKINQSAYFRPHLKSKKVKGLYFIGSSIHPGNGVSVVIDGSKVLCEIIENNKK